MSDVEKLCSTIETRPDNNSIGRLTHLLNTDETIDHEKILNQCGKYLSGINLEEFFELILKKNQINLVEKYLRNVEDISEKQLIQSLNLSFDYLLLILTKRYDYWSLTNAMKLYFNSSKSVELGEQLVSYLIHFQQPTSSIIDWLCALIDAHFSSFVLAKWNKIHLIEKFVQDRLNTFDLLQGLNTIKKTTSSSSTTTTTNKKTLDNLYILQRVHFK
ncbi:unnamed protein product [Rotaria magnacalcarata]|uniref:Uncharacterized protein n=1 Tax=Rotaria magnacalcarata TaxID=392030 RepID=A0A814XVU0_9BILA|nr:unnamed protein product [Rotaria magnacalcarata]CAF1334661.1 unnamed protein product [Rotaria magnacalcarata]CAF1912972.1 unnamed protein product [Rotaria magnacalcarata]CAF1931480.1 unnamed protein product [Rotaria magnacalcarata]CAF3843364.1 unnamed protein product [Rotaria magnacalcarata]